MGRISTGLGTSWESALALGFFVFCLSSLSVRCFQRAVESFRALERARGAVGPRGFILLSQPHTHIVQSRITPIQNSHTSITSRRSTPRPIARAQHQNTARARPIARRSASVDRSRSRSLGRDRRGESVRREMDAEARGGDARARSSASASSYGTHAMGRTMMMMPPTRRRRRRLRRRRRRRRL